MRRFMLGLTATVTLLVLTLSFKTSASGHGRLLNPASAHATATPGHSTGAAAPSGTRTVTGPTADTQFGPVQVRITLAGRRITGIEAVQTPSDASYSRQVAAYAVPILRREALAAQSAHIDAVSGATWTSQGYADSLQGALDRAGI
jgi:uncharacterized protein with FMN-binding domain